MAALPVLLLFRPRGPATVAWLVVSIVVDAIKGVVNRAWPKIGKKSNKGTAPAFTHHDAASAIVGKPWMFRVVAPPDHRSPACVLGRVLAETGVSMLSAVKAFAVKASARFSVSNSQIAGQDDRYNSARATTTPSYWEVLSLSMENGQAPDLFAGAFL